MSGHQERGEPRGRARATARGRPPLQPMGRGAGGEVRRPGASAPNGSNGRGRTATSQNAPAVGRSGSTSVANVTAGVAGLSVTNSNDGGGSTSTAISRSSARPFSRGAMRDGRELNPAELLNTRPAALVTKKGTVGDPIKLISNYFALKTTTNWCLYHYNVSFSHDEDRTSIRKALLSGQLRQYGGYLFDGNSLFMSIRLPENPLVFFATRTYDNVQIQITVTFTNDLQPSDVAYLQVFGILMRRCLTKLNLTLIGRNYFDGAAATPIPQYNLTLWPGYITSIRQHEGNILMCAEIVTKVMRRDTAWHVAQTCMNQRTGNFRDNFLKAIVGATVKTSYNDKYYKISDVDFTRTPTSRFPLRDGSEISFVEFYQNHWNVRINDLKQPLLIYNCKPREVRAGQNPQIHLVPELCLMTGLSEEMLNNHTLTREVSNYTRVGPNRRVERLLELNNRLQSNPAIVGELREWHMDLDRNLVKIDGRILPAFKLIAGRELKYDSGEHSDWTHHVRNKPMFVNVNLQDWTVVVTERARADTQRFVNMIISAGNGMGFRIGQPQYHVIQQDRIGDYLGAIDAILSTGVCRLIMAIFPNQREDRYMAVKKKCYVDRAMASQVVVEKSIRAKSAMSIATKVAIQMNCKLGGAPWSISIPIKGLMVIGFDVYHDPRAKENSCGAMVASLRTSKTSEISTFSRYYSSVSFHRDGNELSGNFETDIANALRAQFESCGELPKVIVMYRDGVGDGQIPHVKDIEVESMKKGMSRIYGSGKLPQLAFIVVSKRINTRIFTDTRNPDNPPTGTVVDDVITFPHKYDFFCVSQTVRQGTVSPTSYNVIHDETDLSPDHIQRLTYAMTHMYFNWSGTVRVPAVCQYAHKLAYMAGHTLRTNPSRAMEKENLLYFL